MEIMKLPPRKVARPVVGAKWKQPACPVTVTGDSINGDTAVLNETMTHLKRTRLDYTLFD